MNGVGTCVREREAVQKAKEPKSSGAGLMYGWSPLMGCDRKPAEHGWCRWPIISEQTARILHPTAVPVARLLAK